MAPLAQWAHCKHDPMGLWVPGNNQHACEYYNGIAAVLQRVANVTLPNTLATTPCCM